MRIAYVTEPLEIELRASRSEYSELASLMVSGRDEVVELKVAGDPAPYEKFAHRLAIRCSEGLRVGIKLCAETGTVTISGDPQWLAILASNLQTFGVDTDADGHLHVEYFEGHFYLDAASQPLICAFAKEVG